MMPVSNKQRHKQLIGRKEIVDFPELGIFGIAAKIDTGAYTSTLHCRDIKVKENEKGLCFKVLDPSHPIYSEKEQCVKGFSRKKIRNSFGEEEERYIIVTKIKIAGRVIKSIISLTDRGKMKYPVLIGRRILKNKFIVDVSLKN
jgi:hypothetical protein